ncbi:MAG TPA: type I DNA topoisomerase [Candidatus Saccharimonadales bacterium]|nr:type I DNA topoisomerase [Candidatus Saccharimonadales bacterium]
MSKNLVIVESPAKAKTIEKYLGSDYQVKSSFGHIRDLPKSGLSVDIDNDFKPEYEIPADKKKIVSELKKSIDDNTSVWLASDEDREGEAIAWHLCQALKLDPQHTKRIVFHEITKPAIEQAIKNPRSVNQNLVDAQQARRVLDRIVGYELSPVLWKKVQAGLSAGRVQSVAVRLIVEREREIQAFKPGFSYKVQAIFAVGGSELKAELPKSLQDDKTATEFLNGCKDAQFKIAGTEKKSGTRNPSPPFTTSSLQQEASIKLGFSVRQTMSVAQRLYESGQITYMRTDSTNLSNLAIDSAGKYIKEKFGNDYHQSRQYRTKNTSAQEAHEAIRPTNFALEKAGADDAQQKLYQLIWKRAIASQMASAKIKKTEISIEISTRPETFLAKGEIMEFDGYTRVWGTGKEDVILPDLQIGSTLDMKRIQANQYYDRPPSRYSEASLVKKLEELGIGRPSTYAPTISTIQSRGYVKKSDSEGKKRELKIITLQDGIVKQGKTTENTGVERNKLLPTYLAEVTNDFLTKHFAPILDYKFTAHVETDFDKIAGGEAVWHQTIKDFYKDFAPLVKESEKVSRRETSQARDLGKHPKTGRPVYARYGRYGPMLQIGDAEDKDKPQFAPLPEGSSINTITLEQALKMFELPRVVGKTEDGQEITASIGRFGPYIKIGTTFVSIKPNDPHTIDEETARKLYAAKKQDEANKYIKKFPGGLAIIRGPFGPYVTDGKKNAKLPKGIKHEELDKESAQEILDSAPVRKSRRG